MSTKTRWVVVDDADSSISWDGQWFVRTDSFAENRNGFAYRGAQHGTKNAGNMTFTFTGTRLKVAGTSQVSNTSDILDPTWKCFVDGKDVGLAPASVNFPANRWALCNATALGKLSDGEHTLVINVEPKANTFWLDQIQYLPPASAKSSIDHPTVSIQPSDASIQYPVGRWEQSKSGSDSLYTTDIGATLNMTFSGTKLTWVGVTTKDYPSGPSTATYSIDGQSPKTFTIQGLPNGSNGEYHKTFFETDILPSGNHTLTVVHQGTSAPLYLDYFLVEGGDIIVPDASLAPNGKTGKDAGMKQTSTPVGAIVGGVIGGLALIVIAFLVWFFLRKRQRKRAAKAPHIDSFHGGPVADFSAPSMYQPTPFVSPGPIHSQNNLVAQYEGAPLLSGTSTETQTAYSSSTNPVYSEKAFGARAAPISVVRHQDSGIRLPPPGAQVVNVPPSYSVD